MLILCTACNSKEEIIKEELIAPANDSFVMAMIPDNLYQRLNNNNLHLENYEFKALYKDIYASDLTDINNHIIRLTSRKKVLIEVLSISCSHCQELLNDINSYNCNEYDLILYFDNGNADEVNELIQDIAIDEDIIIIPKNDGLSRYIREDLKLEKYPTSLFYVDDILSFCFGGTFDDKQFETMKDLGFDNPIDKETFIIDGNNIIDMCRNISDVKDDLSTENQNKLKDAVISDEAVDMTYSLMSKPVDFNDLNNVNSLIYLNEIEDYAYYQDKDVIIFFPTVESDEDIDFINSLMEENSTYEYFAIMDDSFYSNSDRYLNLNHKLNCKVASSLAAIPSFLNDIYIVNKPSALFIKNGIMMGICIEIKDNETFKKATDIFIDNPIAYVSNN
ncbi:MAG: hypothetical protein Q4D13_01145 [Erysipelotrichaceae bacterium]|nr:hypothetical protein [Erysipelotrichaceae bacterium]